MLFVLIRLFYRRVLSAFELLFLLASTLLVRLDPFFEQPALSVVACTISIRHVTVALGLSGTHVAPSLLEMLHDLLSRPLLVEHFEHFPLLQQEKQFLAKMGKAPTS